MMIQNKINQLSQLVNPTQEEKNLLQQYGHVQRKIVEGIKAHIAAWNNVSVIMSREQSEDQGCS